MKRPHTYPAARIPDVSKTLIAKLYIVQHQSGKTRKEFVNDCCRAGYSFSESQLDRWVAKVRTSDTAVSNEKQSGNPAVCDREQRDITSGWVLDQNSHGEAVHLETYCSFVWDQFGVEISHTTAFRYLHEDGFSYRTMQKKAKTFAVDIDILKQELWEWVDNQKFTSDRSRIASVDFTFTSHRTERASSFAARGSAQAMKTSAAPIFTNCIVTCVWADGVNRTPPMLFTYNQEFRTDRKSTARRAAQVDHLKECLKRYGVSLDRVVYVGKLKGEKQQYVRESPDLLRRFFKNYSGPKDVTVFSDSGNSFFEDGESVLVKLGFMEHECYPASVHQWLSPNDNRIHGTAKSTWRESKIDHSDDLESSISLLHYLDRDIIKHSKHWFERNMIDLKKDDVGGLILSSQGKLAHVHKEWLRTYRIWMGVDARGNMPEKTDNVSDKLDGVYWE